MPGFPHTPNKVGIRWVGRIQVLAERTADPAKIAGQSSIIPPDSNRGGIGF